MKLVRNYSNFLNTNASPLKQQQELPQFFRHSLLINLAFPSGKPGVFRSEHVFLNSINPFRDKHKHAPLITNPNFQFYFRFPIKVKEEEEELSRNFPLYNFLS